MIDYDTPLREGYVTALAGQIMIEGSPIPVVDQKLDLNINEHDIYIRFDTQSGQQVNNKTNFGANVTMNVNIVQRTKSVAGKIVVDDVAKQVLVIMFPTRKTKGITVDPPLKLALCRFENSNTTPLIAIPEGFLIVKTLIFTNRLYQ